MTPLIYAALIAGAGVAAQTPVQTPAPAQAQTPASAPLQRVNPQWPPYLPARRAEPPNVPDYLAPIEQGTSGPVQGALLAGDIEDATGGLLRAAGPVTEHTVTVHTGAMASGTIFSVPVVFADVVQADDGIVVDKMRLAPGGQLYKRQYIGHGDRLPIFTVTAWCGQFQQGGIGGGHMLLCLEKQEDGRAKIYYAAQDPLHQELYAAWFASGLVDRNWGSIDWPKLTPVTAPGQGVAADMTLELVVKAAKGQVSKGGGAPWFGWWLSKRGETYPVLLNADELNGKAETIGDVEDDRLIVPMRSQALLFTRDEAAGTVQLTGAVKP